ncbi:gephyrin-like molybdotransferase Glp [uncultured Clostridium sp.]|uniref:molybdopterin molybdotransferase MoeA n=1 Tax=uncultured Clostridium sp. TaxID=59620 RepID=UPI0027DB5484|nr:gephyrin-like molybdotransferase Glp [uncultured Clostridium sp.]
MKSFISLEEAIEMLNENVKTMEFEEVQLIDAIDKVLAEDVYSLINNPPFNKSAMDGYAVMYEDTNESGKVLQIIDEVFAGEASNKEVTAGTAIKIMTGAPIPKGANAVIKKEDVEVKENSIILKKQLKENENICFKGEDIKEGQLLVRNGKKLNYADIGIIASSGISMIKVYKKPKVAFISTGDEVVDIGQNLSYGKIFNSNKYTILARIKELGYEVINVKHVNDQYDDIGNTIKEICNMADLVITTGGASVGDKDLIKEAIDEINGEKLFWKIKIKPGSSVLCSKYNNTVIISLSGNPTAALTTFELLARTSLERMSGGSKIEIKREKAVLLNDFNKKSPQRRFLRGQLQYMDGKQCVYITQVKSGNGILSSTLNSNCIIELAAGNAGVSQGTMVDIIKF